MTSRIFIAGLLGAIAMFLWSTIAHVATPLGEAGIQQIPKEASVNAAMAASLGDRNGLFFFPWVDMNAPDAMAKSAAAMKAGPSGLLIYHPAGKGVSDMVAPMIGEFVKQLIMCLIAAWLVSMAAIAGFLNRMVFVTAIGLIAALSTNASYLIWYGFPLTYTLSYMLIELVEFLCAGAVIAWWLQRGEKSLIH